MLAEEWPAAKADAASAPGGSDVGCHHRRTLPRIGESRLSTASPPLLKGFASMRKDDRPGSQDTTQTPSGLSGLRARASDYLPAGIHALVLASVAKVSQFLDKYRSDKSARTAIHVVLVANCCLIGLHSFLELIAYFDFYFDTLYRPDLLITTDLGYPEMLCYFQLAVLGGLMLHVFVQTRHVIYASLGIIFLFALGDDALQLHERVGLYAASIDLPAPSPFNAYHFGQVLHWLVIGAACVALLVYGLLSSGAEDRKIGAIFVLLIFMLGFFSGFMDAVYVVLRGKFFASHFILGVVEEGGEMLTIGIAVSAALLLHRHLDDLRRSPWRCVRSRPPP
jgi:hypothetical protein